MPQIVTYGLEEFFLFFSILMTVALNLDPSSSTGVGVFLVGSTLAFVFSFAVGPSTVPWDAIQS